MLIHIFHPIQKRKDLLGHFLYLITLQTYSHIVSIVYTMCHPTDKSLLPGMLYGLNFTDNNVIVFMFDYPPCITYQLGQV